MMNRQRCITGLIFILGLMLGCGIWQQRSQAAGQARQWLQHFAPATGGNHVVGASAFGVSPAAAVMFAPTFVESGATLTLTLSAANETLSIVSNGTSYTFTSNNLWSGTNSANVTGNGTTTLTVTTAGLAAFSQISITDAAVAGTSVTFNNSGANVYTDNFDIVLDDPGAGRITFNGTTSFTGANTLSASTSRNILVSNGAQVTTADGDLTLLANQQATPTAADFIGIWVSDSLVRATGAGNVIVKGKGGSGSGSGSYGIFVSGSNAQITANGGTVLVEGIGGGVGTSPANIGVGIQSGAVITNAGTSASATVTVRGFGGNLTGTSGNSNYGLAITGTNTQITASGGAVLVEGTGGGAGTSNLNFGVYVDSGGVITNVGTGVGATVTVRGSGGNLTGSGGDNHTGVVVGGANTKITANGGAVLVEGTGGGAGTSGGNGGVVVQSGGVITNAGTGASATVTVRGNGGNLTGSGSQNHGVLVNIANAQITASGGAVLVEGTGGGAGTGSTSIGVWVASDGIISNAGTGTGATVTVRGTGGNLTGTGNQNSGVVVQNPNTQITSSGGAISVIGSGGSGTGSPAIWLVAGGQIVATTGTPTVTLSGDSMSLQSAPSINAGANPVVLKPRTAGTLINFGGADVLTGSPLTLGLTDTELDQVTAGTLTIGDNTSGAITVSADLTRTASTNISLVSGGDVRLSGGQVNTGGGTLLLDPGVAPFAVKPTKSLTDVTASTLSFGSDLAITINGQTVDTQYTQLNVAGAVNLTGVDLILSGAFVPAPGNVFTIVAASNVTGIFNGLPNGSSFLFNGQTLQIAYTATTATLTVPNTAPTITAGAALTRQRGSAGSASTIATVSDSDTPVGSLVVTATTVPAGITVTSITNTAGTITANVAADCTAFIGVNTVVLTVTDGNSSTTTANLTVNVTANTAPSVTYAAAAVNAGASTTNSPTSATDNGSITGYSVQSQGTYTGTISVNAAGVASISNAAPVGTHTITIRATDNCGATTDAMYTLSVTCPTITVTNPATTSGTAGVAFSQTFTQTGGTGATTFSTVSPLPTGLTLATNGVLSGTPTQTGTFTLVIKATDGNNCTGTANYALTIACPTITLGALPNGTAGTAYSGTLSASPVGTYQFSSADKPAWLNLASNGALSGTPPLPGTVNFNLTITNGTCQQTLAATLTIACPTLTVHPTTLPNGVQGTAYSQTLTASPMGTTYTFAVTAGALPPGLTLNGNGALSGTPTAGGNYTFTITTTGWGDCTGTRTYNILITGTCATLIVNPATLPGGTTGTAYNQTVSATGGTEPYTFSVSQGALPPGLTLNPSTGALTGAPTQGGTFSFRLTATGAGGCTGSRSYVVTISCAALTFTPTTLPNITRNSSYSQTLTISPAGVYTFSVLLGSLPPGFSLSSAGVLSGVTSQTGTFNFTVKAVGATCQGLKAYTLVSHANTAALAQLADYNGDGQSDFALWSPNGTWRLSLSAGAQRQTQTQTWGAVGDLTLLGDYDGDHLTDLAVFRPANGTWYVQRSGDGSSLVKAWGTSGDVPVPGDYDGDGQTDLAVFRPGDGNWYVLRSSDQQYEITAWGAGSAPYHDLAVPGDYDGDGKTDLAVFRRSTGTWYIKRSSDGQLMVKAWGLGTDVPVPHDYDGDGRCELAVWRANTGTWYLWQSATDSPRVMEWGAGIAPFNDQAAPGDYDGDGQADIAVWRAADQTWYIRGSADNRVQIQPFGQAGETPVSANRR